MDIEDFRHNYKYKFILPGLQIISWALMVFGPLYFPVQYQKFCIIILTFFCVKSTIMAIISIVAYFKTNKLLERAIKLQEQQHFQNEVGQEIIHIFIIPSYEEDYELLSQTIDKLTIYPSTRTNIIVFLAMEAVEEGSRQKAEKLVEKYQGQFRSMGYTLHELREFEQRGKAANISWCTQQLEQICFAPLGIDRDRVMITIIDADTWVPPIYLKEIEDHLASQGNFARMDKFIYTPNQIFTRNHLEVPIFTRTLDQFHSCLHHSNMLSIFNLGNPLSNYSLSYNLAKKIGFWDTCYDAIGEDFHIGLKAVWKRHGDIETIPIYACLNQANIQTDQGYFSNIQARFWQAERHARAVTDVAYCFNMLVRQPFNFRSFFYTEQALQTFLVPATFPWVVIAATFQSKILFHYVKPSPELYSGQVIDWFINYSTACFFVSYFLYYIIKRKATTILYSRENESFLRILEYPLMFPINMSVMTIPIFVIAAFAALFVEREWIVSDKKALNEDQTD